MPAPDMVGHEER